MDDFIDLAITVAPFVAFLLAVNLSNRWVTRKERQLLEKSLGRPMRRGEEDSLSIWLRVPKAQLEEAVRELDKNPFTPIVDVTTSIARLNPTKTVATNNQHEPRHPATPSDGRNKATAGK